MRSHRKVCRGGEADDNNKQIFRLKAEPDIEPVSIEEENQDQRTWELHQTTGNENDEETYQIVETTATSDLDESFQQEILESPEIIPIHAVQQVVPSASTNNISVSEIVVSDVAERISKAKIKKLTHRTKEQNSTTSYTIVESQSTPKKEDIDTALSIFLISSNLTFDLVDSEHFRKFVKALNPNYKIPTSTQLKSNVLNKLSSTTASTISHESVGSGKRSLIYEDSDEDPDEHDKRPKM